MIQYVIFLCRITKPMTGRHEETRIRLYVRTEPDALYKINLDTMRGLYTFPKPRLNNLFKAGECAAKNEQNVRRINGIHIPPF